MQSIEAELIAVAVGLVFDSERRILIGQRSYPDMFKGKWEFPGGKIRSSESVEEALRRELWEEVGITVGRSDHFMRFEHEYPDRRVMLNFRLVRDYQGVPVSREQQPLRWVELPRLNEFDLLVPNIAVIDNLKAQFGS